MHTYLSTKDESNSVAHKRPASHFESPFGNFAKRFFEPNEVFFITLRTELEDVAWVNLLFPFSPAGGALQSSVLSFIHHK